MSNRNYQAPRVRTVSVHQVLSELGPARARVYGSDEENDSPFGGFGNDEEDD